MKYFFDTEFNENVDPVDLISLGIVAEDGRELYCILEGYSRHAEYLRNAESGDSVYRKEPLENFRQLHSCNDWVKKYVLPVMHINPWEMPQGSSMVIGGVPDVKSAVTRFFHGDPKPELWAYYGAYDWFMLTRMWRGYDNLPKPWPSCSYDLKQFAKHAGIQVSNLPTKFTPQHNALVDARWTKFAFEDLMKAWRSITFGSSEGMWP